MQKKQTKTIKDTDVIDLGRLAKAVVKKLWLVVIVALLFGGAAYMGTKAMIPPTYTSSFTAYINNRAEQSNAAVTSSDVTAARSLTSTYAAILVSQPVLEEAAESAEINMSYGALAGAVKTSTVNDTEIIRVSVTMDNPDTAAAYTQALAKVAPTYIAKIVEGSSMQVIASPTQSASQSGPNYRRNTEYGFALGALLVICVIVIKDLMDDRIKSEKEVEDRYGIAVMGTIPDLVEAKKTNSSGYKARKE